MQPADARVRAGDAQAATGLPGESDIDVARRAARVHCAIDWPEGLRCNNCQAPFPCSVHRWAREVLTRAGWADAAIAALDRRTGPWS